MEEICNNGIDDDGDGLVDYFDPDCHDGPLECYELELPQDSTAFTPRFKCSFDHPNIVSYAPPMFADIDGDGVTEIVALSHDNPNGFFVINSEDCSLEHSVTVDNDIINKAGGLVLGDADLDGYVDIYVPVGLNIQRWEYDPGTATMVQIWSVGPCAFARRNHLDIWDMNQDGVPEIIPNVGNMVDAVTGYIYPGAVPTINNEGKGLFAFSADGDLVTGAGQGAVELIIGTKAYRYDFVNEAWDLAQSSSAIDWQENANTSIADVDLDGDLDAVTIDFVEGKALIWDIQSDQLLGGGVWDYPDTLGGRANITNIDDDDYPEFIFTTRFNMYVVDDIVTTGGFGNVLWIEKTSDFSGHTQVTSFDFDRDGEYEIVYRDEQELRIFRGRGTGVPEDGYPSGPLVLMTSGYGSCQSGTGMEYPTIGDVDDDEQAEIIVSCESGVRIVESLDFPWADATSVWNTQAFNVSNVNEDGTIPAVPIENYTIYNNFLSQIVVEEDQDSVPIPIPDLFAELISTNTGCSTEATVTIRVCNQGDNVNNLDIPFSLYNGDPRDTGIFLQTITLNEVIDVGNCLEYEFMVDGISGAQLNIFLVLNDDGTVMPPITLDAMSSGGDFPITGISECDYTNNLINFPLANVPIVQNLSEFLCQGDNI